MDFLDPQKQKAHARRLALGYALLGLVVLLSTTVLVYLASGYWLDKEGRVIQNGLVFLSSQPAGADIVMNGQRTDTTNARLVLPAGSYAADITREGYRPWKRALTVEGGSVERFDYPFLFPTKLAAATTTQYAASRAFSTQSIDRRWLLTDGATLDTFDVYDLSAEEPAPQSVPLPADIYTVATVTKGWEPVEWADNNRHVVLKRLYDRSGQAGFEYILFDRDDPAKTQNLGVVFGVNPTQLGLRNRKHDQYYLYDQQAAQLLTATLKRPTPQPYIQGVLAFAHHKDTVVYTTAANAPDGKVLVRLYQDGKTYTVRSIAKDGQHVLALGQYNDTWYVAAGSQREDKVYIYQDPAAALEDKDKPVLVPAHILKVPGATQVSFSTNARFVAVQNADHFATYDAERDKGYAYRLKTPPDAARPQAAWMDGFRLHVTSDGKLVVFDFDGANQQTLMPLAPATLPFFDREYRFVYAWTTGHALSSTALRTPEDL